MLITPLAQLQLSHRNSLLVATPDGQRIVVASQSKVLVLDENLVTLFEYDIGYQIDNLTISPNGQMLAITNEEGQLLVIQIDGKVLFEEIHPTGSKMYCNGCLFSNDGTQLWNIVEVENYQVQVQYRETEKWNVLKSTVLQSGDSFSYFSFIPHPENKVLAAGEAAGQDGSWVHWIWEDKGEIKVLEIPELENKITPEFHPAGGEFLVVDNLSDLRRYRFPDCHLMGTATLELEEDYFQYYMCYLSDERAIIKSENGRLLIVDLDSLKVIDEVILAGYEPCPTNELFPSLADEKTLCGNLSSFQRVGKNRIVSIHNNFYEKQQSTLLIWGDNLLFGECSQPSLMAPYTAQLIQTITNANVQEK